MIGYDNVRFVLKKSGHNPLIVIGINPSTADEHVSDNTIDKLRVYCERWGFDGFIMLNLYPLRSTKPDDLPKDVDLDIFNKNIEYVLDCIKDNSTPILFAYGDLKRCPSYLFSCRDRIIELISSLPLRRYYCLGSLTKLGNPRHPSRLSYNVELNQFSLPLNK